MYAGQLAARIKVVLINKDIVNALKVERLSPKAEIFVVRLCGCARVQYIVDAQLAEVAPLGRDTLRLLDPDLKMCSFKRTKPVTNLKRIRHTPMFVAGLLRGLTHSADETN